MNRKNILNRMLIIALCGCIVLCGCTADQNKRTDTAEKNTKKSTQMSSILNDSEKMGYKKNEIEDVPMGYIQDCDRQGTIETLEYTAPDYTGSGEECTKKAKVYLPFGYDETKEYPVFYLMHGMGDDETWYFGDTTKTINSFLGCILDHMIAGGDLEPCIVCTPTYQNTYCPDDASGADVFYQELVNDLIPALEGEYATAYRTLCRKQTGEEQEALPVQQTEEKTRLSRGFGGFSMGAVTAWNVFRHCLKEIGFFMPISGTPWACNSEELAESV